MSVDRVRVRVAFIVIVTIHSYSYRLAFMVVIAALAVATVTGGVVLSEAPHVHIPLLIPSYQKERVLGSGLGYD